MCARRLSTLSITKPSTPTHTLQIEHYKAFYPEVVSDGADQTLKTAAAIVKQIRTRQLYCLAAEMVVPVEVLKSGSWRVSVGS